MAKKKSSTSRTFHYFFKALMQHKFLTFSLTASVIITSLLRTIVVPVGVSEMIGRLSSGDFVFENYIPTIIIVVGSSAIANLVMVRISDFIDWSLDAKCGFYLSNLAFDSVITQSMTFHSNRFSGSLTSQANKLSSAFINLKSSFIWDFLPLVLVTTLTIGTIFVVSPIYAAILTVAIIIFVIISLVTFKKSRHIDEALAAAETRQTGQLADSITNIQSVKSYARENHERSRFANVARGTYKATFRVAKASFVRGSLLNFTNLVAFAILLIIIVNGHSLFGFSVANVVLLYTMTDRYFNEAWSFPHVLRTLNRSLGDAKEMIEILDEPPVVVDKSNKELVIKTAEIDFHSITFTHADKNTPLFKEFSLKIPDGQRFGLVGVSGSGKTTLTKLLLRFADVDSGQILIDGQDISNVTQNSLRENIAYVPQETALFHRSIAENIAYGKPEASHEEILHAARLANADEFVHDLPEGYDTLVGERGIKLSGGQRQRIAIARAILKDAPILVLDEATSALDSESESLIQDALKELMEGRTSLVIAHRLSTVASLDRIIVLKDGKIVEQGTHQELIKASGEYAKLWSRQTGSFLDTDD